MKSYSIDNNQRIVFLHGIDKNVKAILEFINKTKKRYDVYADSKGPEYVIRIDSLRKGYIEFKKRGGHIRFITEITKGNLDYSKKMIGLVELRHIAGIKGIVRINETEYQSNFVIQESKLESIVVQSNIKESVKEQQQIFETLWNKAISAERRIKQILEETTKDDDDYITMIHKIKSPKRLQLWKNPYQNEYAIRLEGEPEFLVASKPKTPYTNLVAESDYLDDLKYNWKYTLQYWIKSVGSTKNSTSNNEKNNNITTL
jgi:hypothetical protein